MILGFFFEGADKNDWVEAFRLVNPNLELRCWPEWGDFEDINYVLVWAPPGDIIEKCANLKAIISLGAGVEHLLAIKAYLPANVPGYSREYCQHVAGILNGGPAYYVHIQN